MEPDLFLLQCCAALAPAEMFVKRVVERFGLLDYLSLDASKGNKYVLYTVIFCMFSSFVQSILLLFAFLLISCCPFC